jgi:AraC-like DNA-binding protein/ligand-binding sensor protein
MPKIIRQALASRIQNLPALRELLVDFTEATGVPARFLPLITTDWSAGGSESTPLCTRLWNESTGYQFCQKFRQKLRDEATSQAAIGICDAGLWEALVPVCIGGQAVGHLLLSGCAEDTASTATLNRVRHLLDRAGISLSSAALAALRSQSLIVGQRRRDSLVRLLQLTADRQALILTEQLVTAPSELPAVVAQACKLVHAEFATPLQAAPVAARLGVSPGHFSRTFHRATGLRFVEYLARYRAERAHALVSEGDRPIAEIARTCGFSSLSQFNRVFRTVYQICPRALRSC